jgi:hypothetical protein
MKIFYILLFSLLLTTKGFSQARLPQQEVPSAVRCYPNPAITQITFDLQYPNPRDYSLQIFSFIGKKIYDQSLSNQKTIVDLSDYYRGFYIYQVKDKTGKIVDSGRFQVSK